MKKFSLLSVVISLVFTSNLYAQGEAPLLTQRSYDGISQVHNTDKTLPFEKISSLSQEETILITNPSHNTDKHSSERSYSLRSSGSFAVYDKDFREFLDYGASISMGMEKQVKEKLSVSANIDLVMLKGDWRIAGDRETIVIEADEWFPGYVPGPGQDITAEDLPDANLGTSYSAGGEAIITSAESLKSIDVETTLFLLPITLNVKHWIHKDKKINPYVGGGLGVCLARRDAKSRAVKEERFEGPEYRIDLNKSQFVNGLILQFLAGFEVPLKNNMKIIAEASTGLYNLKQFDPILEISYKVPNPYWYEGSDLSQWNYEEPFEFGVFKETFVTSVMVGFMIPF